ncbi:cbb3-type cytochrome oxidase assembly protein CcoS [Halioxenophilus aromaticivorans]|uniref:Cbb3-type cytochrome oxidase assembly protein CcoS n=1 Tax=Halioxenophilus aromaticivorans TaxID=1306992 RepID=A0AAV3TZ74_9ALTE
MEILYLLVPIALVFIFFAVKVLFWAINSGQYDDLDTEASKILFDDKPKSKPTASDKAEQEKPQGEP